MRKKSAESVAASSPTWETLEAFARHHMQQLLQRVLEEEVDGLLGRARYERREPVDAAVGYRNGFGKPRRLSLSNGTITLRRPRVRGLSERFESRLLPAFKRRSPCGDCSATARRCPRRPLSDIYENGSPVKAHLFLCTSVSLAPHVATDAAAKLSSSENIPIFRDTLLLMHTLASRVSLGCRRKIPLSIYPRMQAHDVQCNRRRMWRRGWGVPINKRSSRPWQRSR